MKPAHCLLFFLMIGISGCTKTEEVVEQKFSDGSPRMVVTYEIDGDGRHKVKSKKFYEGGQVEYIGYFNEAGQRKGRWVYYYPNGELWSECEYESGKRHGYSAVYFKNGQKRYEGNYEDDKAIGTWKFWNEEGALIQELENPNTTTPTP